MSTVKNLIMSVSVTLVFFGVMMLLLPENKMKKPFISFLSVALVAGVISVVSSVNTSMYNFNMDFSDKSVNTDDMGAFSRQFNVHTAEQTVVTIIKSELISEGVDFFEVSANADISEDNSILLTDVVILCNVKDKAKCEQVLEKYGLNGRVVVKQ